MNSHSTAAFAPAPGQGDPTAVAGSQRSLPPEHRVLLLAALGEGQAALDGYRQWRESADLDELDDEAYRLLPRLYRNLALLGVQDAQLPRLRGIYRRTWYGNRLALLWINEVLSTLVKGVVESRVLTGAVLNLQYFDDPGACPLAGLDLLIRPEQVQTALAVLAGIGWRVTSREQNGDPSLPGGDIACTLQRAEGEALGLHWRIVHGLSDAEREVAEEELWRRVLPLEGHGLHAAALGAIDQLLFLVDYGFNNPTCAAIRWCFDSAAVIQGQPDLSWEELVVTARQRHRAGELAEIFACLQASVGLAVPPTIVGQLRTEIQPAPAQRRGPPEHLGAAGRVSYAGRTLWASYRRTTGKATVPGFVRYLTAHWELTSIWDVPGTIAARTAHMLRWRGGG